jgi:hypothetical protein
MPEASGRRWRARNEPPRRRERRDAQGGGSMEAGADDNQRIMTSDSLLPIKPVIMQLSADPSESLIRTAGALKRSWISAWKIYTGSFARGLGEGVNNQISSAFKT